MKRIITLLCVLALLGGLAIPAMAAPDTVTVHVMLLNDWTGANLYAWYDEYNVITSDWPGDAMVQDGDWYVMDIPADTPYIIVNNSYDYTQTEDIAIEPGRDVWIVVYPDYYELNYYEPDFDENEPVDDVTIHAYVPEGVTPNLWAWSASAMKDAFDEWPGEAMEWDGDWWTLEVPGWCDSYIINDGDAVQTDDLQWEAEKELWIVVEYDWNAWLFDEEPDISDFEMTEPDEDPDIDPDEDPDIEPDEDPDDEPVFDPDEDPDVDPGEEEDTDKDEDEDKDSDKDEDEDKDSDKDEDEDKDSDKDEDEDKDSDKDEDEDEDEDEDDKKSEDESPIMLYILIGCGGLLVVVIVVIIILIVKKKR